MKMIAALEDTDDEFFSDYDVSRGVNVGLEAQKFA